MKHVRFYYYHHRLYCRSNEINITSRAHELPKKKQYNLTKKLLAKSINAAIQKKNDCAISRKSKSIIRNNKSTHKILSIYQIAIQVSTVLFDVQCKISGVTNKMHILKKHTKLIHVIFACSIIDWTHKSGKNMRKNRMRKTIARFGWFNRMICYTRPQHLKQSTNSCTDFKLNQIKWPLCWKHRYCFQNVEMSQ